MSKERDWDGNGRRVQQELRSVSDEELAAELRNPDRADLGIGGYVLPMAEAIARLLDGLTLMVEIQPPKASEPPPKPPAHQDPGHPW